MCIRDSLKLDGTIYSELLNSFAAKKEVTITLTPLGEVSGVVYTAVDRKPVVGITVSLFTPYSRSTQTNQDGRFQFNNVPITSSYPNQYLYAASPDGDYAEASVALKKHGDAVVQDMTMTGFSEAVVTVTNGSGAPIAGAEVYISGRRTYLRAVTDNAGVATFQSILSGKYTAQAKFRTSTYYRASASFTVEAGKKTSVHLTLLSGTIQGQVLAADRSTPVPNVELFLDYWGMKTVSDNEGRFSFSSVDVGTYTLDARVSGRRRASRYISLTTDGEVKTEEIVLNAVGTAVSYTHLTLPTTPYV